MFDTVGCSYFSLLNEFFCCQATFRRSDYLFRVFSFPPPDLNTEKLAANLQSTCGDPDAYVTTLHFCSIGSSCLLLICLSGRWHLAVLCVHMCAIYSAFPSVITWPFHNPRSGQIGVDVQWDSNNKRSSKLNCRVSKQGNNIHLIRQRETDRVGLQMTKKSRDGQYTEG